MIAIAAMLIARMVGLSQSSLARRLNHISAGVPVVQQPQSAISTVWSIATLSGEWEDVKSLSSS
jgi:hypothetical protein